MKKLQKVKLFRFGKVTEGVSADFETEYWGCSFCNDLDYKAKSAVVLRLLYKKTDYPEIKDLPKTYEFEWRPIK